MLTLANTALRRRIVAIPAASRATYGAPLHFALGGSEVIEAATGAMLPAAAPGGISIVIEGLTYTVAALGLLELCVLLLLPLFPLITAFQAPARQHHVQSEALGEPVIEHEHVHEHVAVDSAGEHVMLSEVHSAGTPYWIFLEGKAAGITARPFDGCT